MTRRTFLAILALLAPSGFFACRREDEASAPAASLEDRLRRDLLDEFHYLSIGDEVLAPFALAYLQHHPDFDPENAKHLHDLRSTFLMSTDFFQNAADESRPLRFVALYDPYVTPCYNPMIAGA